MLLTFYERRWAQVIGGSLIPASAFGGARADCDIGAELAAGARSYPWWSFLVLRLALWLVWFSPLLAGQAATFGRLDPVQREAALERLLASPVFVVRQLADFLKLYLCVTILGNVDLLRQLAAYDLRLPPQGTWRAPIEEPDEPGQPAPVISPNAIAKAP